MMNIHKSLAISDTILTHLYLNNLQSYWNHCVEQPAMFFLTIYHTTFDYFRTKKRKN